MRLEGEKKKRQRPPFPTRQTKRPKKPPSRERERDRQAEGGGQQESKRQKEREERGREMVSQKVIKKQVEEQGRMVGPQSQRRIIDKRACESMLGGQTGCQMHRHQTHEGKDEDESLCSWVEKSSLRALWAEYSSLIYRVQG